MADVTVTYKGSNIAELSASGSATLETAGKYCEANIGIAYVKSGGTDLSGMEIYVADFVGDPPTITAGALNTLGRYIVGR